MQRDGVRGSAAAREGGRRVSPGRRLKAALAQDRLDSPSQQSTGQAAQNITFPCFIFLHETLFHYFFNMWRTI